MRFADILYGTIELPEWLIPFLKIPEFVRLRGVRLSNVDSFEFKDFNGPTRWEHCVGVAYLAMRCAKKKGLSHNDTVHLVLAALLHDVATPPFAHTIEYVLEGFDHELESNIILGANTSVNSNPSFPIYASQLPMFRELCKKTSKLHKLKIEPDIVAEMVIGGGELGFLINGTIDLDNIDNVTRASLFLGIEVDRKVPLALVDWLSQYDKVPTELESSTNVCVTEWIGYKNKMYGKFFTSSDDELGRQAFLQHLIRRAYNAGLSKKAIIWNTDEALLNSIEGFSEKYSQESTKNIFNYPTPLKELVQQYRLLESPIKLLEILIDGADSFKSVKNPLFAKWLEDQLTTPTFEPFVIVNSKRYNSQNTLFNKEAGIIQIYKLGNMELKFGQLAPWIQSSLVDKLKTNKHDVNSLIRSRVYNSLDEKPWLNLTDVRKDNIRANLDNIGNWSFRLSRNESIHSYPATFVHAIPASLITALGIKGELILDPFGGTGQTAMEAVKLGCKVISSDSNAIASLVSKVKLSYLTKENRAAALSIDENKILANEPTIIPNFNNINKWHHGKTIIELCKIKSLIDNEEDLILKNFYKVCFSDILTACTARKGKEHGYFADNTPLSKGEIAPSYENALKLFVNKIKRNINIIEKSYSFFERNGLPTNEELANASIYQKDITKVTYLDYNIEPNSIAGIITSPPYLCMADYTLGQRLSYYWLFPESINIDFQNEIGSRRSRMQKENALINYLAQMRLFARNSASLLKENGFLATVIGAPKANSYKTENILNQLDKIFLEEGLELFWETNRPINWHRNHGYARLKEERIAIHIRK
jgi:DNA modification methylase